MSPFIRFDLSPQRIIRLAIATWIVVLTLAVCLINPVNSQDATPDPSTERVKVGALLCLDWSCLEFGERLDGFTIYAVEINSGVTFDSCVTEAASEFEGCWLEIPANAQWTLTFDEAQTPEGYVFHGSIIGVQDGAYGSVTYLPFHPIEEEEPGQMVVQAALCTDKSCTEYEKLLDNFLITAINPVTGQEYSECITDNAQQGLDHQCILDVPAKGDLALIWVADQLPEGYVPFGKPITAGEPAVTTLAFAPGSRTSTPAPVTALPVTGTQGPDGQDVKVFAALVLATVLVGAAFVTHARNRPQ